MEARDPRILPVEIDLSPLSGSGDEITGDGIVVTTVPTWTQVEKLLWGEIHRAVQ